MNEVGIKGKKYRRSDKNNLITRSKELYCAKGKGRENKFQDFLKKNCDDLYTGLFEMIVRVLTTCHTQYT